MHKVLDVEERGDLVDYNGIGEEKNCGSGEGGRQPPHCFTLPLLDLLRFTLALLYPCFNLPLLCLKRGGGPGPSGPLGDSIPVFRYEIE